MTGGEHTDAQQFKLLQMEARKDSAYHERNRCVALIARIALASGWRAGTARTAIEGWSTDWHGCVYVDLPTGQVSWHYHDSDAGLFADIPPYTAPWDGHDTPEKYRRVASAFRGGSPMAIATLTTAAKELAARLRAAPVWVRHDQYANPEPQGYTRDTAPAEAADLLDMLAAPAAQQTAQPMTDLAVADGFTRWAMGPAPANWWAMTEAGKCKAAYARGVRDAEREHKIGEAAA